MNKVCYVKPYLWFGLTIILSACGGSKESMPKESIGTHILIECCESIMAATYRAVAADIPYAFANSRIGVMHIGRGEVTNPTSDSNIPAYWQMFSQHVSPSQLMLLQAPTNQLSGPKTHENFRRTLAYANQAIDQYQLDYLILYESSMNRSSEDTVVGKSFGTAAETMIDNTPAVVGYTAGVAGALLIAPFPIRNDYYSSSLDAFVIDARQHTYKKYRVFSDVRKEPFRIIKTGERGPKAWEEFNRLRAAQMQQVFDRFIQAIVTGSPRT